MALATYTVKRGDSLWKIASGGCGSNVAASISGSTINAKIDTLVKLNNIKNRNLIYVNQVLKLSNTSSSSSSSSSSSTSPGVPNITAFGLQSEDTTGRAMYVAWSYSRSNLKNFKVRWSYYANNMWMGPVDQETSEGGSAFCNDTYSAPENASKVKVRVAAIANTDSNNNKYWSDVWSSEKVYDFSNNPPYPPGTPEVEIKDYTLTASINNIDAAKLNAESVEFEIIKNNSSSLGSYTAKINTATNYVSYVHIVDAGAEYKVRARCKKGSKISGWSDFSNNVGTKPSIPAAITTCKANSYSDNEVTAYLEWTTVNNADTYDIQYTTNKNYFDGSDQTTDITGIKFNHYEITSLELGKEYFFRVRAVNQNGESDWSEIKSTAVGTTPAAPTTWSSTTTAVVGEPLNLYWVHNSEDNSSETYAELRLYVDDVLQSPDITIKKSTEEDEKDKTSVYSLMKGSTGIITANQRGMFSWKHDDLTTDYQYMSVICDTLELTEVYQSFRWNSLDESVATAIKYLQTNTKNNVKVCYLCGEAAWYNTEDALAHINKIIEYNNEIGSNAKINKILLDVEPWTLGLETSVWLSSYTAMLANAKDAANNANLTLGVVVPFWLDTSESINDQSVYKSIIDNSDELYVMNYNRRAYEDAMDNEVVYCKTLNKPIYSIAECQEPNEEYGVTDYLTYYNVGLNELNSNWLQLKNKYNYSNLNFAYHDYQAMKSLVTLTYPEGTQIKWQVRTAGVTKVYGDWSVQRVVDIYAKPILELAVTTLPDGTGDIVDTLTSFPFYIYALPGPKTQYPIGYQLKVTANEYYETIDDTGLTKMVNKGEDIYSKHFDISDALIVEMSADNLSIEADIQYTITCIVTMNSGLTAETSHDFIASWTDTSYNINADVTIDQETLTALITPYSQDDEGTLVEDITLSVYRREFDGTFKELAKDIPNTNSITVSDPHPALDYARYRIVGKTISTGAVTYYDLPGVKVGGKAAIIQWNEEWSVFDASEEYSAEKPSWSGSMLTLPYNIDVSDKHDVDSELVSYIGRKHPVAYYGTQLGQSSTWNMEIPRDDKDTLYAIRRLAIWTGDVYVREPSGSGYWANISVSYSQTHKEVTIPISLTITRVEGGI